MNKSTPRSQGTHAFPVRPLALLAGTLMLTACAQTRTADQHAPPYSRLVGHPAMPEDNLPNPARNVVDGPGIERMQSGVPIGRRL